MLTETLDAEGGAGGGGGCYCSFCCCCCCCCCLALAPLLNHVQSLSSCLMSTFSFCSGIIDYSTECHACSDLKRYFKGWRRHLTHHQMFNAWNAFSPASHGDTVHSWVSVWMPILLGIFIFSPPLPLCATLSLLATAVRIAFHWMWIKFIAHTRHLLDELSVHCCICWFYACAGPMLRWIKICQGHESPRVLQFSEWSNHSSWVRYLCVGSLTPSSLCPLSSSPHNKLPRQVPLAACDLSPFHSLLSLSLLVPSRFVNHRSLRQEKNVRQSTGKCFLPLSVSPSPLREGCKHNLTVIWWWWWRRALNVDLQSVLSTEQ